MKKILAGVIPAAVVSVSASAGDGAFLKNNERWMFSGDSITSTDTYRQIIRRVVDHYHPDNKIVMQNAGVWGRLSSEDFPDGKSDRTLVSIMLGMNDIIHHDWGVEPNVDKIRENYRKNILKHIHNAKAEGADVILMTPTLTEEYDSSFFSAANTRFGLKQLGEDIRKIAADEGCFLIPVSEEIEAYQKTLGPKETFRPDGVHPYGWGQYTIAKAFINRMNLAGTLNGRRALSGHESVKVKVERVKPFLNRLNEPLELRLSAKKTCKVQVRWSIGKFRGTENVVLTEKPLLWRLPAPAEALKLTPGEWTQAVVDLTDEKGANSLYLIDLARTKVLKADKGTVTGIVKTKEPRSEGPEVAKWKLEETPEGELWFTGSVNADEYPVNHGGMFHNQFGLNGLQLMFDFRPATRFAGLNFDRDVHMILFTVNDKPYFSALTQAWMGRVMQHALFSQITKVPKGWGWTIGFRGNVVDYQKFDIRKLDYYGITIMVADAEKGVVKRYNPMPWLPADNPEKRIFQMMIVDRKGKFPCNETTTVNLFAF